MKAISIDQFGGLEVLKEKDVPIPKPGRSEVRVKIKAVGFNPVDVKRRLGVYPTKFPKILGTDFSGVVDAVGDVAHSYSVGDEVFGLAEGPASNGSYAEFVCVPQQFIAKKPKNLSFEQTAAIPIAYLTAFQALIGCNAFQQGRPLFIAGGSGGVGTAAISLAKAYQSGPIFSMAGSDESLSYLTKQLALPRDQILGYKGLEVNEMAEKLVSMNRGERFYFALDFVGEKIKELCFQVAEFNGHVSTILPEDESFRFLHGAGMKKISFGIKVYRFI